MSNPPKELEAVLLNRSGSRRGKEIQFLCPVHDDHNPSASYNIEKHAWICRACNAHGGWKNLCDRVGLGLLPSASKRGRIAATYPYHDAEDNLLYQVVRKDDPKDFFQRRPDGQGGWISNLKGVERILFRLPQLLAALEAGKEVFIAEGEKDVENLKALGLEATTNPGGAGNWRQGLHQLPPRSTGRIAPGQ